MRGVLSVDGMRSMRGMRSIGEGAGRGGGLLLCVIVYCIITKYAACSAKYAKYITGTPGIAKRFRQL